MIATILPYIMLNLGILGRRYKVFMGDAGGCGWVGFRSGSLQKSDPGQNHPISPVTAVDNRHSANGYGRLCTILLRKGMSHSLQPSALIHRFGSWVCFPSGRRVTLAAALLPSVACWQNIHFVPGGSMLVLFASILPLWILPACAEVAPLLSGDRARLLKSLAFV